MVSLFTHLAEIFVEIKLLRGKKVGAKAFDSPIDDITYKIMNFIALKVCYQSFVKFFHHVGYIIIITSRYPIWIPRIYVMLR